MVHLTTTRNPGEGPETPWSRLPPTDRSGAPGSCLQPQETPGVRNSEPRRRLCLSWDLPSGSPSTSDWLGTFWTSFRRRDGGSRGSRPRRRRSPTGSFRSPVSGDVLSLSEFPTGFWTGIPSFHLDSGPGSGVGDVKEGRCPHFPRGLGVEGPGSGRGHYGSRWGLVWVRVRSSGGEGGGMGWVGTATRVLSTGSGCLCHVQESETFLKWE